MIKLFASAISLARTFHFLILLAKKRVKIASEITVEGTLSNDDGDAKDDALKKMNLYFTVEFRTCLDLSVPLSVSELAQA